MFPLGAVLTPGMGINLHVFEPRYRALVKDCLAGDRELGIVLIERGSEVGGGDVRTAVGTRARIARAEEAPDGRWGLTVIGLHRLRVIDWAPDDPYPRAEVEDWPDPEPGPGHSASLAEVTTTLRRALALAAEAGQAAAPATIELADDPVQAGYQAVALAPLGPFDKQLLLAATSPDERLEQLAGMLAEAMELIEARLTGG